MRDESFADPVRRALPSLNLVHDKPQAKGLEEKGLVREEPVVAMARILTHAISVVPLPPCQRSTKNLFMRPHLFLPPERNMLHFEMNPLNYGYTYHQDPYHASGEVH